MDLPMPEPTIPTLPLPHYKVISFDVYGSLIEYKAHIVRSFQPLLSRLPSSSPYLDPTPLSSNIPNSNTVGAVRFLQLFQRQEDLIKLEKPVRRFDGILAEIWRRIARELQVDTTEAEALAFGSEAVISSWPCFPGTVKALRQLQKNYRLVALSNIDRFAWYTTSSSPSSGLGDVSWWKVFTAEDCPSDAERPLDETRLETLVAYCARYGVQRNEILHVAQSLGHDHAPAKRLGLSSVYLVGDGPRWGKEAESRMVLEKGLVGYGWRCQNLQEFAELVHRAWDNVTPIE
ncbi:hypothetical protein AYO21_05383 [Fonsecaea monophora]|uniref:Haloacid dehalogenase, type II n=2 Tax=Fonsecaea TaxID=40354 RepID=A0A0D2H2A0_9EURO|nr:uncharacterized protein Z517_08633 [Fonsecaea pedrosoi CBS 271.37]XP_022512244.1 hypothetical protein AYO21_05383 [Fonsecaea monophora]KIW78794.1 hypothetical protein Z517_08633 [Fonsecaea pedrosoi CBS 271.37]OAG40292.1 hypothetical protein AYO21_05383 [Fonsecaea monophora]